MKTTQLPIVAYPGNIIVTPLEEKTQLNLGNSEKGKIIKGKVISVGTPYKSELGSEMEIPLKTGQTVYFMAYEGFYDMAIEDGQKYYFVKWGDIKGSL